jgi:hypothetical protein
VNVIKLTILKPRHNRPVRGYAIEIATCPALRHPHTAEGYRRDGCRCPSTIAAWEERKELTRQATARYRAGLPPKEDLLIPRGPRPIREIDDCPAQQHRHSYEGYLKDGCRCPSTIKSYERRRETQRKASKTYRSRRGDPLMNFDLRKADKRDAEALAMGYRITGQVSKHTRAAAVLLMIRSNPRITDRQIVWKLTNAGQLGYTGKPFSIRQIQRTVATLKTKQAAHGQPLLRVVDPDVDAPTTHRVIVKSPEFLHT